MTGSTDRIVRCPACGGPAVYAARNEFRPFCSARCKNNDFGAWASESYAVPEAPEPSDDDDPPPKPRPPRASQ